ncbi:unnamed protein product, partial [marine sediment metagenome]
GKRFGKEIVCRSANRRQIQDQSSSLPVCRSSGQD